MMATALGKITLEFEPIVKLGCLMTDCKNNRGGTCNLKSIVIGKDGQCADLRLKVHIREIKDQEKNESE